MYLARVIRSAARTTYRAARGIPLLGAVLTELRDSAKHLERLAVYATQELPEIVYQLERVRDQLAAIERRLADLPAEPPHKPETPANGADPELSPGARRSG